MLKFQVIGVPSSQTNFHPARCGLLVPTSSVTPLLMIQKRHITLETFENYFSPDVYPIGLAMQYLESVHSLTGLPYSVTIGMYYGHVYSKTCLKRPLINWFSISIIA